MRAAVTGASGFIGVHLCRHLRDQGWDVVAVTRTTSRLEPLEALGVNRTTWDLSDRSSVARITNEADVVFHLAGLTKTLNSAEFLRVNRDGAESLLAACAERQSPPRVVLVSSLAAAGPWHGRPRSEADPAEPVSNYGKSKRAAERIAESLAERVPITVVRPPIVFGEMDRGTLPMFQAIYWSFTHAIPGIIPQRFSLIHVHDLVRLLAAASQGETLVRHDIVTGKGYYFADSGEHVTYGQIGRLIGHSMNRPLTIPLFIPAPLIFLIGGVSELAGWAHGQQCAMNIDKAREATAGSWCCSGAKATAQLGFTVSVPLTERFRQTTQWYRQHGWIGLPALGKNRKADAGGVVQ